MIKFDSVQQVGYIVDGEGDFDEAAHPRDEKGQFSTVHTGKDYDIVQHSGSGLYHYRHKESGSLGAGHVSVKAAAQAAVEHRANTMWRARSGAGPDGTTKFSDLPGAEKAPKMSINMSEVTRRLAEKDF